jgi:hypothetical protein
MDLSKKIWCNKWRLVIISVIFLILSGLISVKASPTVFPTGTTIYYPDKAYKGYALYGDYPKPPWRLIDMNGNILHIWDPKESPRGWKYHGAASSLPNGHVISVNDGKGYLEEYDWNSNLVWRVKNRAHHSEFVTPDGHIVCVVYSPHLVKDSRVPPGRNLQLDGIIEYDENKEVVFEWYMEDHMDDIVVPLANLRTFYTKGTDVFHTNSVAKFPDTPIGRKDPRFREGNYALSIRNANSIIVIDQDTEEMVWQWGPGFLGHQHGLWITDQGTIMCFDCGIFRQKEQDPGAGPTSGHPAHSIVWEVDPSTNKVVWRYSKDEEQAFFSAYLSNVIRLPNGNTFINEGFYGRLFQVAKGDPSKNIYPKIVWEYIKPSKIIGSRGEIEGQRCIFQARFYTPEYVEPILKTYNVSIPILRAVIPPDNSKFRIS